MFSFFTNNETKKAELKDKLQSPLYQAIIQSEIEGVMSSNPGISPRKAADLVAKRSMAKLESNGLLLELAMALAIGIVAGVAAGLIYDWISGQIHNSSSGKVDAKAVLRKLGVKGNLKDAIAPREGEPTLQIKVTSRGLLIYSFKEDDNDPTTDEEMVGILMDPTSLQKFVSEPFSEYKKDFEIELLVLNYNKANSKKVLKMELQEIANGRKQLNELQEEVKAAYDSYVKEHGEDSFTHDSSKTSQVVKAQTPTSVTVEAPKFNDPAAAMILQQYFTTGEEVFLDQAIRLDRDTVNVMCGGDRGSQETTVYKNARKTFKTEWEPKILAAAAGGENS